MLLGDGARGLGGVAPGAGGKAVLLQERAALRQGLGVADDRAHLGQTAARHAQQVLPDGQVAHAGHDQAGVGVEQVQHGGNVPGAGVFKGQHAELGVAVLYGVEHFRPGGEGERPRKGEQPPQGDVAPGALHALVGGGAAAQDGALVCARNVHGLLQKPAVVRAQSLVLQAGGVFFQHGGFPHGVEHRLAGLRLVARHIGHRPHAALEQRRHLGVDAVDLRPGLLQKIHSRKLPSQCFLQKSTLSIA